MKNYLKLTKPFILFGFLLFSASIFAQTETVRGSVTSEEGIPLIGVTILQKGTSNGAVTDFDGKYELKLKPNGDVLVFSYLGFKTEELKITGNTLDVKLYEDSETLDEVVVVGYGTQKKSDVSGAISSIKGEEFKDNVVVSVGQALQGRASGVYVTEASGEPGSGVSVNIRGLNSLSGNSQPLYILDGIPLSLDAQASDGDTYTATNPLASLNPNDIESVEILKDASSTAIYGSRASNGVIIITTKSAQAGKVKIEGRIRTSIVSAGVPYKLLTAPQYNQARNDWALIDNPSILPENLPFPDININGEGTDFMGALFRISNMKDYAVSLSGGTENFSQLLSLNFSDQEGIIINSKFNRGNLRYNSKLNLTDRWSLNTNMQLNFIRNQRVLTSARTGLTGVVYNAFRINPNRPLIGDDGEFFDEDEDGDFVANPVANALNDDSVLKNRDAIIGINNSYRLTDDLIWTTRVGLTHRLSNNKSFANISSARGRRDNGNLRVSNAIRTAVTLESFFNYDKTFGKHNITALLGVGYEDFTTETDAHTYLDFTFDNLGANAIQLANQVSSYRSGKSNFTLQSGFSRLGYTYNDKYILTFNVRADGTSKFINGTPWGYFPSAAFAWNVNKEPFLRRFKPISQLKLRASYGETGSQAGVGPLSTQAVYAINRIGLANDVLYTATYPDGIANFELTWETSKAYNFGVDFGLFKNRIRGSVDYYERTTTNLLNNLPIPPQTGFGRVALNRGELENKGLEVELDFRIIQNQNFKWNSRLNWSTNKTIVNNYGSQEFFDGPPIATNFFNLPTSRTTIGEEVGLFFGYNIIGLIQVDDLVDYANGDFTVRNGDDGEPLFVSTGSNNRPGTWIFEDVNNDGVINIEDRKTIGNPNPDFFFGWNNRFTIGNFNISAFVQGSFGNDILNVNKGFTGVGWNGGNSTEEWYNNRWTLENQHNDINFPSGQQDNTVSGANSVYVEDGSYVRLKNLSLTYNIPAKNGPSKLSLTLTGTNMFTWTNYSGVDPEVDTNAGNALSRGIDYSAYPRPKIYSIGLDFNF
jgi:TonB-linked SusC/RagA family outer membrane protein